METIKIHAIELDAEGRFVCDAPDFDTETPNLDNWTADRCPDGFYRARYTGFRGNNGEWSGGEWVDGAAPDLLSSVKDAKRAQVNRWRDEQERAGFEWNGHRWDSDAAARERISAVALAGISPPTGAWTDADDNDVPMTADNMIDLYHAMVMLGGQIHARQRAMKAEIDALTTVDAVNDYAIGWPG